MAQIYPISEGDDLGYRFDFAPKTNGRGKSDWLSPGEKIAMHTLTKSPGLTISDSRLDDNATSVVYMCQPAVSFSNYEWVLCKITSDADPPQIKNKRMRFKIGDDE